MRRLPFCLAILLLAVSVNLIRSLFVRKLEARA